MANTVSYQIVADDLGVSVASVRNWIKCGYLESASSGQVDVISFGEFKRSIAGQDKLVSRANKSLFDSHDHQELSDKIAVEIGRAGGAENLSDIYEEGLSNSFKNKEGIYYTPSKIADEFFRVIPFSVTSSTFCDPCCGTGNFLISAIDAGFKPENIYGYDTDSTAVEIAKSRIYEKTGCRANIYVVDFFEQAGDRFVKQFDVVMTNPPWGKKLPKDQKALLGQVIGAGKSTDTSALFMLSAIDWVHDGGIVGMLLPESFFNVMSFKDAREIILSHKLLEASCYGKPFKGVMAKAKSLIIQKDGENRGRVVCKTPEGVFERAQDSFVRNPNFIINEGISPEEDEAISKVFEFPHVTLKDNAKWALGIVTGNNKRFVTDKMEPGYVPVFTGKNITTHGEMVPKSFIPDDFSIYQQVAPVEMYSAKSKIIYKFISSKLVFRHDTKKRYVLNSVNIFIPSDGIGVCNSVLAEYLSSNFMNWLFRSVFGSHKILRADLEKLPIFNGLLSGSNCFNEDDLLNEIGLEKGENGTFRAKK